MRPLTFTASIALLFLGAFLVWLGIQRYTIPETPRTTVTIPEGWSVEDINRHLVEEGVLVDSLISQDEEGYLFPDTYEFFLDSSPEVVVRKFRQNLALQMEKAGLDPSREDMGDIIIMASLLEREVKTLKEKRIVSGILWKRLENEIPLQVDATLCYIKQPEECLPITAGDKGIDSRYNTYLYRGLPAGPIGNPGIDSLLAATKPAATPYWYYLSSQVNGETVFAETLDEHNQNIIKYLSE